jgi:hypothetical protein
MFTHLIQLMHSSERLPFLGLRSPSQILIQRLSRPGAYHAVDGFGRSLYFGKTRCFADRLPVQISGWASEVIWNLSIRDDRSDWYDKKAWLLNSGGYFQVVQIDDEGERTKFEKFAIAQLQPLANFNGRGLSYSQWRAQITAYFA